ncbi:hypothetical protein MTR67_038589 [Solanum verrucosum]|uniref:Small-subunit processome Utp12 domain-containing protein n=1 Tax=Solanum verrucosum TaxID=315347 RepID=A0AAF0UG32_SOLVR|nr:hypothetical protein MTR67_038589 [Solanum verrucosum]
MAVVELNRIVEHQVSFPSSLELGNWMWRGDKSKGKVSKFRPNILMLGLSPYDYVFCALSSVHTNDLEQTLLLELVCRVSTLLLQLHHHQLISTVSAKPLVIRLEDIIPPIVKELKDIIGVNLAKLHHIKLAHLL